ncbi:type IV secretory system conjugative DNA transfer family protein [Methylorubrum sp. SB2]|uniref:type IV secretory system conjugative DNA transfer family protein n=1 Tax=Methylorubrum subtropicum TaxID=3138812 RepID=UPI00313CF0C0
MIVQTVNTVLMSLRATLWLSGTAINLSWKVSKWTYKSIRGRQKPDNDDAYLSELPELRKLGHTRHTGGFYVGRFYRSDYYDGLWQAGLERVYTDAESSVVMVGKKKAGKSQSIIADIRAHAHLDPGRHPDLIVYDPVGEIQQATEPFLRRMGWDVRAIDVDQPERGQQCDPLQVIRLGMQGYDFMLALLGQSIIPKPVKNPENENHFPKGARAALIGMIAWEQANNPHGCTLQSCMERIVAKQDHIKDLIDLMQQSPSALVRNNVKFLTIISPKEYGSFASTMATYFGPYMYDGVMALNRTRADADGVCLEPVNFLDIFQGSRKTAIFIRTGLYGDEPGAILRLMMSNAINTKRWLLNSRPHGTPYEKVRGLHRPLKIYTDETKTLGNCTALVDVNDELRKARVNTFTCWLTRADIYNNLAGAKNLIGGATLVLAGGSNDAETNADFSKLMGEKREESQGRSYSRSGSTESYHEQFRPLMNIHQIRNVPRSKRIVVMDQIQFLPHNTFDFKKGVARY